MTIGLYVHAQTPLHRLPAGAKIAALVISGLGVFLLRDLAALSGMLAAVAGLYWAARIPASLVITQLRPLAVVLALFLLVHGALTTWELGVLVVLRFAILVLLGLLVTLTTRTSAMVDALERALQPLDRLGIRPTKVSLAVSLAFRFIPLVADRAREVREAQQARGLERNVIALAVPLVVRTLRMAGDLSDAIEARGFDSGTRQSVSGPTESKAQRP